MRLLHLVLLAILGAGCATAPGVSSRSLPLKKVVIYRNGVAYFERQGRVSGDALTFQVRPDHVGDFLATLAVMERGGSSVRSASFPLAVEDKAGPPAGPSATSRLSTVTLGLDGKHHELAVGYVAEQPVWKPSYRLIFENDKPTLQAWGIVQNVSGEDWRDVSLSLIAGAPIAFRSTLGTPVTPGRPVVSDSGEVIAAVPRSESTLAQEAPQAVATPAPPPAPSMAPAAPEPFGREDGGGPGKGSGAGAGLPRRAMKKAPEAEAFGEDAASAARPYVSGSMGPRELTYLAARTVQAGATRYDVPHAVTVPNDSATMVLFLSQPVPGESVFMFAPEGGVPDSARHPFRVARFKNSTEGLLERGPLAVFDEGAFLGQGVLEALSSQGEAIVPFAVDRSIAVEQERRSETLDARLSKIEHGQLFVERDQVAQATYRIRNGGQKAVRVVVRHGRQQGFRLHAPPTGTEEQVGKGAALVPANIAARATSELKVEERRAFSLQVDWFSNEADAAVKTYLADPRADAKLVAALKEAWGIRERIQKGTQEVQKLRSEKAILDRAANEARESLKAISRTKNGVGELRQKLSTRLIEVDERLAELNKRLVEVELGLGQQRVAFNEVVRTLQLKEPLSQAANT